MDSFFNDDMDFENRIVDSSYTPMDAETEISLRPKTLDDYVGDQVLEELRAVDLNTLSPYEAMSFLFDLKKRLK